jgi:DNA-binding MarR family transcriptional regulator
MTQKEKIICRGIDISQYLYNFRSGDTDLTLRQLRTLRYIQEKGTVRASDLADEFNVTPATITAQIDRLVKTGWLERVNSEEDRRAINIALTKLAQKNLKKITQDNLDKLDWVFDPLNKGEQDQLLKILEKIHAYRKSIN